MRKSVILQCQRRPESFADNLTQEPHPSSWVMRCDVKERPDSVTAICSGIYRRISVMSKIRLRLGPNIQQFRPIHSEIKMSISLKDTVAPKS